MAWIIFNWIRNVLRLSYAKFNLKCLINRCWIEVDECVFLKSTVFANTEIYTHTHFEKCYAFQILVRLQMRWHRPNIKIFSTEFSYRIAFYSVFRAQVSCWVSPFRPYSSREYSDDNISITQSNWEFQVRSTHRRQHTITWSHISHFGEEKQR